MRVRLLQHFRDDLRGDTPDYPQEQAERLIKAEIAEPYYEEDWGGDEPSVLSDDDLADLAATTPPLTDPATDQVVGFTDADAPPDV